MKNLDLAIPFDEKIIQESIWKKIFSKIKRIAISMYKRVIDIILSLMGIIFLIPACIFIKYTYLRKKDYKSIFITEECIGKNGKIFKAIKFRSINKSGDYNALRKTGLDNLPKLMNILLGNMTIVGPQPYLEKDKEKMGTYYNRIIQMKPGITGITQISLKRDKLFEDRLDDDIRYFYQRNFKLNLKIILITLLITVPRRARGETFDYIQYTFKDIGNVILNGIRAFIKRVIDIIGAIVGILILIPTTIFVVIGNFISGDRGPVFYSHDRIGKDGKIFKLYKFRSMVLNADEKLKEILENDKKMQKEYEKYKKLKDDPRITKVGKFLRKTSLDEFPQFWNVLKGDMSLVGPRPYMVKELNEMSRYYPIIIQHKPGITGLWQTKGRSDTTFDERLDMDLEYHNNNGIIIDAKLLIDTVAKVLTKQGAI